MNKVVCNSSPIIGLSMINKIDLLWNIFDEVYITDEVFNEIAKGNSSSSVGERELIRAVGEGKIKIYTIKNKELVEQLYGRLHRGELEVMIAAKELKIKRVIIDDRSARNFAEGMLLKTIGVIGLLILGKQLGKISEVKKYLDLLISNNYRISKKLYKQALIMANEEENLF